MADNNRMAVGGNIMPSPSKPMAPEQSDGSGSEGSDAIPSKPMAPDQSDGSESKGSDAIPSKSMAISHGDGQADSLPTLSDGVILFFE